MNDKLIKEKVEDFVEVLRENYADSATKYKRKYNPVLEEMTDADIEIMVVKYFTDFDDLTSANNYFYKAFEKYVPNTWDQIDHSLERDVLEETPAYKQWSHNSDVSSAWYYAMRNCNLEKAFCDIHGKKRTDEEAAKLAASKWCELLFGWHLQDNGALNEDHPGGFQACALGTVIANNAKDKITDEMKQKAYDLFVQYYLHDIEYQNGDWHKAVVWAKENLPDPDKEKPYEWSSYSFSGNNMYCDYHPYMPLYLVLINAGIPEYEAGAICPWKTGIDIRALDNTVKYHTYQHCEEL